MTTKTTTAAATTTATVPNLFRKDYEGLSKKEQKAFLRMKGEIIENNEVTEEEIESDFDMEAEEEDKGKTSADYNLEGDAAFANIITTIGTKVFRLRGYKLTELSACMDEWDSATKSWGAIHGPTMNIINMLRHHGADTINRLQTSVVEFRQAGEKDTSPQIDVVAELLKEEAETAEALAETSLKVKLAELAKLTETAETAEASPSPFEEELSEDELMVLKLQEKIAAAKKK